MLGKGGAYLGLILFFVLIYGSIIILLLLGLLSRVALFSLLGIPLLFKLMTL